LEAAQAIRDHCGARDPDAVAARLTDRPRLIEALDSLPPGMRAVVTLRDVYGLPHKDIAVSLGITETAAKVRLHRARKILRESLFETAEGCQSSQDNSQDKLLESSTEDCAHETGQGKENRLAV
jgi:DNA-directed RNA polymerase specialized sigma24 family protein